MSDATQPSKILANNIITLYENSAVYSLQGYLLLLPYHITGHAGKKMAGVQ